MADTRTKNLPENVDLVVLDGAGELRTNVGLEELPYLLADNETLIWCDVASTDGGQSGSYGRLLREVFGFDELVVVPLVLSGYTEGHDRRRNHPNPQLPPLP